MCNLCELRIGNYILFNKLPTMVKGVTENAIKLNGFLR